MIPWLQIQPQIGLSVEFLGMFFKKERVENADLTTRDPTLPVAPATNTTLLSFLESFSFPVPGSLWSFLVPVETPDSLTLNFDSFFTFSVLRENRPVNVSNHAIISYMTKRFIMLLLQKQVKNRVLSWLLSLPCQLEEPTNNTYPQHHVNAEKILHLRRGYITHASWISTG